MVVVVKRSKNRLSPKTTKIRPYAHPSPTKEKSIGKVLYWRAQSTGCRFAASQAVGCRAPSSNWGASGWASYAEGRNVSRAPKENSGPKDERGVGEGICYDVVKEKNLFLRTWIDFVKSTHSLFLVLQSLDYQTNPSSFEPPMMRAA